GHQQSSGSDRTLGHVLEVISCGRLNGLVGRREVETLAGGTLELENGNLFLDGDLLDVLCGGLHRAADGRLQPVGATGNSQRSHQELNRDFGARTNENRRATLGLAALRSRRPSFRQIDLDASPYAYLELLRFCEAKPRAGQQTKNRQKLAAQLHLPQP